MQQRLSHKVWEQAALHYHGLGAENGVDMTILHKHHKRLVARGAHTRAGMLYKIATAQIYDGPRVCEHDPDAQVACALCGSPDDSMFHRVYDCPCTPTSFELDKTDQVVDEARMRAFSCPIFWFRGLPPSSWYPELPFAEQPFAEDFGSLDIVGGHVFTDGSGGTETKDPRLRRCGYGVAWVLANGGMLNTLGGRAGILHGRIQSVARAELLAAVVALELCVNATQQVIIWTDCMFVVNGFARGRRRRHLSHARDGAKCGGVSRATTQEPIKTMTKKGVKRAGLAPAKLSWLPGWLSFCSVVRLCFWFLVLCLVAPVFPGSGSWAGVREKGRRPKNRSRRFFARAGLSQVFPGMLAVLERRYRGRILTLVHIVFYSPPSSFVVLSTHRRRPVEEPPRAERALRGGVRFLQCLSRLCFLLPLWRPLSHFTGMFSPRTISEVAKSLDVRVPSPFLLLSPWSKFSQVFAEENAVSISLRSFNVFDKVSGQFKFRALIGNTRCFVDGFDVQVGRLDRRLHQAASGFLRPIFE